MPYAKLVFKLPEEREEHLIAVRAMNYKSALDSMDEYFRNRIRYEDSLSDEVKEALNLARNELAGLVLEAEE